MDKRPRDYLDAIRIVGWILITAPILWSLLIFISGLVSGYNPVWNTPAGYGYSFGLFIFTGVLMVMYASFIRGKEESMSKLEKLEKEKQDQWH
jgi:hypothetical protein